MATTDRSPPLPGLPALALDVLLEAPEILLHLPADQTQGVPGPLGGAARVKSIRKATRQRVSPSAWKRTSPVERDLPTVRHTTRSSGRCSVISASNSRVTPPTLITQCVMEELGRSTRRTPRMNRGKHSN